MIVEGSRDKNLLGDGLVGFHPDTPVGGCPSPAARPDEGAHSRLVKKKQDRRRAPLAAVQIAGGCSVAGIRKIGREEAAVLVAVFSHEKEESRDSPVVKRELLAGRRSCRRRLRIAALGFNWSWSRFTREKELVRTSRTFKNKSRTLKNTQEHSRTMKNTQEQIKNTIAFRENISNLYNALGRESIWAAKRCQMGCLNLYPSPCIYTTRAALNKV
ncbi:hypothetical protein LXL04_006597 [Taraxacum kok-saghyz]